MSGAFVTIDLRGLESLQAKIDRLAGLDAARLKPLLVEIGDIVVESVQRNFEEHRSPDGEKWQELAESTKAYKESKGKNAEDILIFGSYLLHSIHSEVHGGSVEVGTDRVYGAVHQFGIGERSVISSKRRMPEIPARPYLGIRDDDYDSIEAAIDDFIAGVLQ